jgi:hypothetical protein
MQAPDEQRLDKNDFSTSWVGKSIDNPAFGKGPTHPPHRIGGAYCNPPFDQMLLIPRGTPIGVMFRSQTSPKLPTCLITL